MGSPDEEHRGRPRLKHRAEHLLLRGVLGSFGALAPGSALGRGARLGRLWRVLDRRHRGLAERNIAAALGLPPAEARRVALACFEHLGRTLAEFALGPERFGDLRARFEVEGLERFHAALAAGRGVFLLSGHCGNWELFGARLALEAPMTTVARAMSNPLSDDALEQRRRAAGVRTVDARNASRGILRALGRGETVGVLLDQNASRGERVFTTFFGRPAATSFGLALLALKTGAPVLPVFSVRRPDGTHAGWVGEPIEPAPGADRAERIGRTTARYTAAIEDFVRRHPEQWFWVHNRWKRVPEQGEPVWSP